MKRALFAAVAALSLAAAPAAFAGDCSPEQAQAAGTAAAQLVKAKVSPAAAVQGKQMMNVTSCFVAGGKTSVEFKYNFMGADGYYWAEGKASVEAGEVNIRKVSPNLEAAAKAANIQLASN